MTPNPQPDLTDAITIREYRPEDQPAVAALYTDGLLSGQIPDNDTGADVENVEEAYIQPSRNGFWIAEVDDQVVGMVGVAEDEPNQAEIRRLRVQKGMQGKGVGNQLMEKALSFCRHHGYLKVILDTRLEKGPAIEMFERFGFQHHRSRNAPEKELQEFYLDLYRDPDSDRENSGK
jgi:ribosomal protein S18 acetylase RimI-like enzyme